MSGTKEDVANALENFFKSAVSPILFAGAGVSMRAGLPDWKELLKQMAEAIRSKDPSIANIMCEYVSKGSLTKAANFFETTDEITDIEKHNIIKKILSRYDCAPLLATATLPFTGVLTTNFDRSINDAIAQSKSKSPMDYVLGDSRFIQSAFETDLFVSRIHGGLEYMNTIVLSEDKFKALLNNQQYFDILSQNLLSRSILFLGFSFYDPAIKFVFEELQKRFGSALPGKHLAILPDTNESEFLTKAGRLGLSVIKYNTQDQHAALWDGIELYVEKDKKRSSKTIKQVYRPYSTAKHYFAACYARANTILERTPLREVIVEGIVSAILQQFHPKAASLNEIQENVRRAIGVKGIEIEECITQALKELISAGLIRKHKTQGERGEKYAWHGIPSAESSLKTAVERLSTSIINRCYVELGWKIESHVINVVTSVLDEIIHRRGWDLGAAFAAGRTPDPLQIKSILAETASMLPRFDIQRLEMVLDSLFISPTEEESALLGELGRISFALELAFQAPRTTLLHKATLPRRIYLDANFMLPAFVQGHPHQSIFSSALQRLLDAAKRSSIKTEIIAYSGYLNEIISHRNLALAYQKEAGDDFLKILKSDAMFHGTGNINAFLGGFINTVHNGNNWDFSAYLKATAPYSTEIDLRRWLTNKNIAIIQRTATPPHSEIYGILERANAGKLAAYHGKVPILLDHDSAQMALLDDDIGKSERALFVTADRQLFEDIQASKFSELCEFMVSSIGFVQYVDVLIGLGAEERTVGDLFWSNRVSEKNSQLRAFLTLEALKKYEKAMDMKLCNVMDEHVDHISSELDRLGVNLDTHDPKARVQAFRSLNTLEEDFFAKLSPGLIKPSTSPY